MSCENHPDKESIATCTICRKDICQDCLIEIAGKPYCKDCVNELVTESILEKTQPQKTEENTPEPTKEKEEKPVEELKKEEEPVEELKKEEEPVEELKKEEEPEKLSKPKFRSASNVKNILEEEGIINEENNAEEVNQEIEIEETITEKYDEENNTNNDPDEDLEAKYEKYLEDLYYDEPENQEQKTIINKEKTQQPTENMGITGEYAKQTQQPTENMGITGEYNYIEDIEKEEDIIVPAHAQKQGDEGLSYEEIRDKITEESPRNDFNSRFREQQKEYEREMRKQHFSENNNQKIENNSLYYEDLINNPRIDENKKDKKKNNDGFTKGEIALSIILIILILIVMSYVIYLFTLSNDYPSYFDAIRVLFTNPAQLFGNIIG